MTRASFSVKEDSGEKRMQLSVYDVGGTRSERESWTQVFEETDIVLFTVDLACYDQPAERSELYCMQDALAEFRYIVKRSRLAKSKKMLCFTRRAKLTERIKHSPFEVYFPVFVPSNPPSPEKTMQYIVNMFKNRVRGYANDLKIIILQDFLSLEEWQIIKQVA